MSKEKFDDATLIRVAKSYFHAGCYDNAAVRVMNKVEKVLNTTDRNILVQYVDKYHDLMFSKKSGLSMKEMRNGLLRKIGAEGAIKHSDYGGNINVVQLRAIYDYIMDIQRLNDDEK